MIENTYNIYDKDGSLLYQDKTRPELMILMNDYDLNFGSVVATGGKYARRYRVEVCRTFEKRNSLPDLLLSDFYKACLPFRKVRWVKKNGRKLVLKGG